MCYYFQYFVYKCMRCKQVCGFDSILIPEHHYPATEPPLRDHRIRQQKFRASGSAFEKFQSYLYAAFWF
jgi:hypothetical protein